ncbi:hypothetical protein, partial [Bifidobacterium jacchi]|uniref:hypothetical protein n=1 Tax=Bifidobacterium jacchi TaxID=2490545 RepID=UPI0019D66390
EQKSGHFTDQWDGTRFTGISALHPTICHDFVGWNAKAGSFRVASHESPGITEYVQVACR